MITALILQDTFKEKPKRHKGQGQGENPEPPHSGDEASWCREMHNLRAPHLTWAVSAGTKLGWKQNSNRIK
jgi:hypothetical protein